MGSARARFGYTFVAALLGCGLLAGVPVSALAAPAGRAAASAAAAHPAGFYVTGLGRVVPGVTSTALVRDSSGAQHVVTSVRSTSATGNRGHVVYLTRRAGAKHWLTREIPGLRPMAGGIRVEIHLSFAGTRVFVVLFQCNGVFVTDASLTSPRLPEPQLVQAANTCSTPASAPRASAAPIVNAIGLPGGEDTIGILLPDPAQGGQETIFSGTVGGTFTPETAYGTTDSVVPKQLTIDLFTGRVTVIGEGTNGTSKGIYDWSKLWWQTTWPAAPVRIASLGSPSADYTVESVTSNKDAIWVGLLKPLFGARTGHTLYTVHGNSAGQWFGAVPLPNTTSHDTALQLLINQSSNHLHAAFTRVNPAAPVKKSGIMSEAFFNGRWRSLKFFTHWDRDYTAQITLTQSGRAILGYVQR